MSEELNILHLIDHLGLGGAQEVVKGLIGNPKDSDMKDVNIQLYSLRQSQFEKKVDHPNIHVYPSSGRYSLKPLFAVKSFIEKQNIHVLHCHLLRSQCFGWILKKMFFPRMTLIFHEHGRVLRGNRVTNCLLRMIRKDVDLFIAVSKFIEEGLISNVDISPEKIRILNNYVNTKKFNPSKIDWDIDREKMNVGIGKDDFVVGFAGRMIRMKGWRVLLSTASLMRNKEEIKFLIAGEGPEKSDVYTAIKDMQLDCKVIYLGFVEDMVWFYSMLDCFIIPSWWEAMGITVIEAQAMQVPVIASDVKSLNEIIKNGENGLLFRVSDPADLAAKIEMLLEKEDLSETIIRNGLKNAKQYRKSVYQDKLKNIYTSIIS